MRYIYKYKLSFLLLVVLIISSCYTRRGTNLLQDRENLPQYEHTPFEEYKLQVNDELLMRVISTSESIISMFPQVRQTSISQKSNYQKSYRIYADGTVDFPYLPRVPLLGKTIKEAEAILEERLSEFANDIEVKLALQTKMFCVIGEAGRGYFPIYKDRMTIFQGLALSGGIKDGAVFSKVRIIRTTNTGTIIKTFDIRTESIIDSEFYYIQPNDIIYLDVSKKKFWASSNLVQFMGLVSSSVTFFLTVLNILQ